MRGFVVVKNKNKGEVSPKDVSDFNNNAFVVTVFWS